MASKISASAGPALTVTEDASALDDLYKDLTREHLAPLWTQVGELMPGQPTPSAHPHVWQWKTLFELAERAGDLVRVERGGERRAIALANPGLGSLPFATPTLWAAIQYLAPGETAPEHRHTQNAFRFVVEGQGVWTVVDGDPVSMQRGDLLLTPGWHFHGHQNVGDVPMAWLDGLDIPFVQQTDSGFFAYGSNTLTDTSTPDRSRAERLWGHPGLQPVALLSARRSSPLAAYRWQHTDRALAEQLEIEREGQPATMGQVMRRCGSATPRRAATSCRPSGRNSTGCAPARSASLGARSVPACGKCLPGADQCRSAASSTSSTAAICSSFRPGPSTN